MSKSLHTLNIEKDNIVYTCDLYTTIKEATVYANSSYLPINVGDSVLYATLYPVIVSQGDFSDFCTPVHIKKGNSEYVLATKSLIRLSVTPKSNQTISVFVGNESWSGGTRYLPYGTEWTATLEADVGYIPGILSPGSSGVLTDSNTTVSASKAIQLPSVNLETFSLKLEGTSNQVITLRYNNRNQSDTGYDPVSTLTSSFSEKQRIVRLGTTWTATVVGDTGWTAGTLSASSGTVIEDTIVSVSSATFKTFILKSSITNNQTLTVKYKNRKSDGTFEAEKTLSSGDSVTVGYGTTWTATVVGATGWTAGTLSPSSSGTVTEDTTVGVSSATFKTFTLKLNTTSNQSVVLKYRNRKSDGVFSAETTLEQGTSVTVGYGTTWTATVVGDTGWTAGTLSASSGTVTEDTTVSVSSATFKTFILKHSASSTNQTLTVKYKNRKSDGTFESEKTLSSGTSVTVGYGTTWTATVVGATGWSAGALVPGSSGTVTTAVTVSATAAIFKTFILKHSASSTNQTLTVKYKNRKSDGTFDSEKTLLSGAAVTVGYGTTWTATISADTGWSAGSLSPSSSGTVTAAVTVSAGAAVYRTFTLSNTSTNHQTLTVKYKNKQSNGTFSNEASLSEGASVTVGYGTTWTATISADTGWSAGSLSASSGTVTAATTVSARDATFKTFTLKLNATSHQTITLKYKNKQSSGSFAAEVTKTSTSSAQSFTVGYGSTWTATVAGSTGYNAGSLSPGSSGTVTAAVTVSAGSAVLKTFTLKLNATSNQTITLKYKNKKSDGTFAAEVTKASTSSAQSFTVGYGTTWTASLAASTGYTRGTLSGSSGTVTAAVTVSATTATVNKYYLRYETSRGGYSSSGYVKYNSSSGSNIASGTQVAYNSLIWVSSRYSYDHYVHKLYKNSGASGTVHATYSAKSFTFRMPASQIYIDNQSYNDDCDCGDDS